MKFSILNDARFVDYIILTLSRMKSDINTSYEDIYNFLLIID